MKVVIHAGIHRTGTTSLQRFFAANRRVLRMLRIAYPGTDKNHQKLVWSLKRGENGANEVLTRIEEATDADTVVLSGEDFCNLKQLEWLEPVAARHEVHAIFYLRRQDHWLMSWYNQHIKWPFERKASQMGPDAFLTKLGEFHWLNYARLLERWEDVLGAGRVAARVVEPGQVEDVTKDFLNHLGLPGERLPKAERINDSLPVHVLEVARHLGLYDLPPEKRRMLLEALRTSLIDKRDLANGARTVYSPTQRRDVLERFSSQNRKVARRHFGRDQLFLEPGPANDEPYFRLPEMSREELLKEWTKPVISHLLHSK